MKTVRSGGKALLILALLFDLSIAIGQELVPFDSEEGIRRLVRAKHTADFGKLLHHFKTQPDNVTCGPTSGIIVTDALRSKHETTPHACTNLIGMPASFNPVAVQESEFELFFIPGVNEIKTLAQIRGEPIQGQQEYGLQLRQMHRMLETHGVSSVLRVMSGKNGANARREIIENLRRSDDYVIANFSRPFLKQPGVGHFSPLGAFDEISDSVLVMDVNPKRVPWFWVSMEDLLGAMSIWDTFENRGYLLVGDGK